jgi:hypothetical protein
MSNFNVRAYSGSYDVSTKWCTMIASKTIINLVVKALLTKSNRTDSESRSFYFERDEYSGVEHVMKPRPKAASTQQQSGKAPNLKDRTWPRPTQVSDEEDVRRM